MQENLCTKYCVLV